ncbi:ATE1 [Symbiodinium sp. KB8]|nr:ATE1 [Symbiodinium sp. KB8]
MPRLQLGRYTALREIQWVQAAHARLPRLRYYYMGYYVHSCQKMRYKADYKPSELLCPVTGRWVHHHEAKPILDKHRFARIAVAEGEGPKDGPAGAASDGAAAEECRTCAERRASVAHMVPAADPAADAAASAWAERVPLLLVRAKQDCVVGNLTASGQSIVRPLLAQFAKLAPQAVADRRNAFALR